MRRPECLLPSRVAELRPAAMPQEPRVAAAREDSMTASQRELGPLGAVASAARGRLRRGRRGGAIPRPRRGKFQSQGFDGDRREAWCSWALFGRALLLGNKRNAELAQHGL